MSNQRQHQREPVVVPPMSERQTNRVNVPAMPRKDPPPQPERKKSK